MARRNSRGSSRRSKQYRNSSFRATCSTCGVTVQVPVRPPKDIPLQCVDCLRKAPAPAPEPKIPQRPVATATEATPAPQS